MTSNGSDGAQHAPTGAAVLGAELARRARELLASGRPADALALLAPVAAESDEPEVHHAMGNCLVALGLSEEAETAYRKAVSLAPDFGKSWSNLGNLLKQRSDCAGALACYDEALRVAPTAAARLNRGLLFEKMGELDRAEVDYAVGVALAPEHARLRAALGSILARRGAWRDAAPHLTVAAQAVDARVDVLCALAEALDESGERTLALGAARDAVERFPMEPKAQETLGSIQLWTNLEAAERCYGEALRLDDTVASAWAGLGRVLERMGRLVQAEKALERSAGLGENPAVLNNLASVLSATRRPERALELYARAIPSAGGLAATIESNHLYEHCYTSMPAGEIFEAHRAWGARWQPPLDRPTYAHDRVRIGYLSPDFRRHSVAYFIEPILRAHDRRRVELYAYFDGVTDETTARLQGLFEVFRQTKGTTDADLAGLIRADEVDVLIDLAGHTADNRMPMLAANAVATLTATYLGYPSTTGNPGIDVRITDDLVDGPEALSTETLWRLHSPAWRYAPPAEAPPIRKREGRAPTFGCFNALNKVSPVVLGSWARVLHLAPDARLLLKAKPLRDPEVAACLRGELEALGIDGSRVELRGWTGSTREHLETYNEVDVALDTFPYHGTTTTCEALWMGVPVVTRLGDTHASRVGLGLLTAVGASRSCKATESEYVDEAVRLLDERGDPNELRRRMQDSPLLCARPVAAELEARIDEALGRRAATGGRG